MNRLTMFNHIITWVRNAEPFRRRFTLIESPWLDARSIASLLVVLMSATAPAIAHEPGGQVATSESPPSIEETVAAMEKLDGLFPLYWDAAAGTLYMEIDRFDEDVLYVRGLAAGLGSNDIGLDRGQGRGSGDLVRFERVGPKILMLQPNLRYRADSENPDERVAVEDAFAQSVLWGFTVAAETDGRTLVDMTEFLVRDTHDVAATLQPAQYRLDSSRSVISREHTKAFPKNIILNAVLTFTTQGDGKRRRRVWDATRAGRRFRARARCLRWPRAPRRSPFARITSSWSCPAMATSHVPSTRDPAPSALRTRTMRCRSAHR